MGIRTMAGAAPFAHLLGLGRASAAKAEQTEQDREDEREGEEDRDREEATAAETEGEEDREEENERPDARGARAASGDESEGEDAEEDEDEEEGGEARAARLAERARCKAIFASPAAAGQPHVAAELAFGTNLSAKQAISLMKATAATAPKSYRASLDQRMSAHRVPSVGGGPAAKAPASGQPGSAAAAALAAYKKARGIA